MAPVIVSRRRLGVLCAAVATLSLAITGAVVMTDRVDPLSTPGISTQVEVVLLLGLLVLCGRWAPPGQVVPATAPAVAAVGLIVLRFRYPGDDGVTVAGIAAWAMVAVVAAAAGLHLRSLDERRVRSVIEAQRDQRLHLARDLHDFVAHDVSEMLALAQAGQVVAAEHPRCAEMFVKIEQAGQRALRSMDQTVRMLHALSPASGDDGAPTLAELPTLVERFAAAANANANANANDIDLDVVLSADEVGRLPHEVSTTLYRVAVEALTNVRRHAQAATAVTVQLRQVATDRGDRAVELSITDDGPGASPRQSDSVGRRNGLGLPALDERVERLGGRFAAGPSTPTGWQVTAALPVPAHDPAVAQTQARAQG